MEYRSLGRIGRVSSLTLGGGGIAGNWGATDRKEAVATIREAVDSGITLIDVAPTYGDGEAELAIGEAFSGRLIDSVRISTKKGIDEDMPPGQVRSVLEQSLAESRARMRLQYIDFFFLHSQIIPDNKAGEFQGTPWSLFVDGVRPVCEELVSEGQIGAWGITGIGFPSMILEALGDEPPPAAVQCIANILDSPGELRRFDEPARPRELIALASERGIGVIGIRAVQSGALTDSIDRALPHDHPCVTDYRRAAPFRSMAHELGESPASLAHRYALSISGVSTVALGVKNRLELRECIAAAERGPLDEELSARIHGLVDIGNDPSPGD